MTWPIPGWHDLLHELCLKNGPLRRRSSKHRPPGQLFATTCCKVCRQKRTGRQLQPQHWVLFKHAASSPTCPQPWIIECLHGSWATLTPSHWLRVCTWLNYTRWKQQAPKFSRPKGSAKTTRAPRRSCCLLYLQQTIKRHGLPTIVAGCGGRHHWPL